MKLIYEYAEAHHGLIRRADALSLGVTKPELDALIRGGQLQRAGRSVYRVPGSVPTWHQRLLAAVWAVGDGAAASHRSAAALAKVPGFNPGPLEVVRPWHTGRRKTSMLVRETNYLPAHHVTELDAIPATVP